ncbi:MAG: ATP-dependent helicase, partial [Cytophaga sp.]|nr:ATP-dependent helicase [Undibacterium sp.]
SDDMKVSKGLEFPVVALPGVGHMPAAGEDEQEAARVFYVAATRATERLVIGVGGSARFGQKLACVLNYVTQQDLSPCLQKR